MNKVYLSAIFALFWLVCSCSNQKTQPDVTPWGTPIGEEDYSSNSNQTQSFTYDDIVSNFYNNGTMSSYPLSDFLH